MSNGKGTSSKKRPPGKQKGKGVARRGPDKVNSLRPPKGPKLEPRVTVVGPGQGIRVTYPDDKTGGLITSSFLKRLKSSDANEAAAKVGKGRHKFGSLKLPLYEEPAFVDAGKPLATAAGKAIVIGNDKYDTKKRMGSVGPMNTALSSCVKDADKMEKALKKQGYKVTKLADQTGSQLKAALKQAAGMLTANKRFVFHFSGHGTFEGFIGIDGGTASPGDVAKLVEKAIDVGADITILADACHQGVTVDRCRKVLFDRVKKHNHDRKKALDFIKTAEAVAGHKDTFNSNGHKIWQDIWKYSELMLQPKLTNKQSTQYLKSYEKAYAKWKTDWNSFVTTAQKDVGAAVNKAKAVKVTFNKLTLKPIPAKVAMEQDQAKKIWAQLDSVDQILNEAVSVHR